MYGFGTDTINRLINANGSGEYTPIIEILTPPITALGKELSDVDVAITLQKGKTYTNDQVMIVFKKIMSDEEGLIASKLGGHNTEAYLQFYPKGISEYSNATKTQMPTLVKRVDKAADINATALGTELTDLLKSYLPLWDNSRAEQEKKKGEVGENRTQCTTARISSELALLIAVHTIGTKFPGDVEKCVQFFDFSMLLGITHHTTKTYPNVLAPSQSKVAFNLTDTMELRIKNTDDNAAIKAYLGYCG